MKTSTERILTTHVGSLPRSKEVTDVVFAHEAGNPVPNAEAVIRDAVMDVVASQVAAGAAVRGDRAGRRFQNHFCG